MFFAAKAFYFSVTSVMILIILKYDNPLTIGMRNDNYLQLILLLVMVTMSAYYYLTTGTNPGFASVIISNEPGNKDKQATQEQELTQDHTYLIIENNE